MVVELKPWEWSDWPIAFKWMRDAWEYVADDDSPKTCEEFVQLQRGRESVAFGVWADDDLCGVLTLAPVTPIVGAGHCTFRQGYGRREITVPALQQAQKIAWKWGYWKIWCLVPENNRAMIRLLEHLGARMDGVLISQIRRDGRPANVISYALLNPSVFGR